MILLPVLYMPRKQGLLDKPGWKRLKGIARRDKKMIRMLNQSRLRSFCRAPIYKNGFRVARTPEEGIEIDKENGTPNGRMQLH